MIDWILYVLIAFEALVFGMMLIKIFTQKKIADIKSTKYFIPTLLINLSIYLIAVLDTGISGFWEVLFLTFEYGIKACVLGVETDLIMPLIDANTLFSVAFILSFVISAFTFVYVFISLVGRSISNFTKCNFINWSKKEKIIIIGYNNDTLEFYKSIKNKKRVIFWVPTENKQEIKKILSNQKLNFVFDMINTKTFKKFNKSHTVFLSFLQDNAQNLALLDAFLKSNNENFKLFVSVDNNFEATYKTSFSAYNINFFNKYSLIAQKFIMDYPITNMLETKYIDTDTATIDKDLTINVFLIGYGYTHKNLFSNLTIDNQFLTLDKEKLAHKKINYYIFDKREYMGDKNFSFNTNRFLQTNFDDNYFTAPAIPFNLKFIPSDVNSKMFYNTLRELLNTQNKENTFNLISTSIASDLENIDQTMRLKQTFTELGFTQNKYFVRLRDASYLKILEPYSDISAFGEFGILNYDTIVCDKLNQFSIDTYFQTCLKRPEILDSFESLNRIRSVKKQTQEIEKLKLTLWKNLDPIIKDYSKYRSINLRTKLNLIGLDTCGTEQVTNKQFYSLYDTKKEIKQKNRQIEYNYPYPDTIQPRNVLAQQEHLRTTAFLITKGYLPMKKQEILELSLDSPLVNTTNRTALMLVDFNELDKIYQTRLNKLKPTKAQTIYLDTKKDLYQVMDDVPLHKYTNYLIYKNDKK